MTEDVPTGLLIPWGKHLLAFHHAGGTVYATDSGIRLRVAKPWKAFWPAVGISAKGDTASKALAELRDQALSLRALLEQELYPDTTLTHHIELVGCPQCPWFRNVRCTHPDAPETDRAPWDVCPIRERAVLITVAR